MTSLVVRKVIIGGAPKLRLVRVGPKVISEGVLKLERVQLKTELNSYTHCRTNIPMFVRR